MSKMVPSGRDWSDQVSEELKDLEYAHTFMSELLVAGDDLKTAMGRFVRLYGSKEYAALAGVSEEALSHAIDPGNDASEALIRKFLAPLNLSL